MAVLWMNLVLVYVFGFYARLYAKPLQAGLDFVKPNWIPAVFAGATIIMVSGLRNGIGDTPFYMSSYADTAFTWASARAQKDSGFNIFQMLLQQISHNPQFMIFVVALITNALILFVFYRYSRLFEISMYVYITSGLFVVSMNGLRQFLAAAVAFAGTKFIFNGNWKAYLLIVLLAAQIHMSALVLIPIYFIIRGKAWSWITVVLLCMSVLIVIGFNQFSSVLYSALDNTQYADYQNAGYHGANVIRVVVYAVPVVLAYLGREKLRQICPYSDYIVNMSLIALVFMIISTQNWIFSRFTIYFGLYSVLLLSWVVKLFVKKEQRFVYFGIIICYFIYHYYETVISLNLYYTSSFLKW